MKDAAPDITYSDYGHRVVSFSSGKSGLMSLYLKPFLPVYNIPYYE
jgi:hypothetical protein